VKGDLYWSATLSNVKLGANIDIGTSEFNMDGYHLGCNPLMGENCSVVIDTGTSLIVAPARITEMITRLIDKWQDEGGDCDDLSSLPDLEFEMNGKPFSLPPTSYVGTMSGEPQSDLKALLPKVFGEKRENSPYGNRGNCVPLIMALDADSQLGSLWILGMPFFRKYYTSFQFETQAIPEMPTPIGMGGTSSQIHLTRDPRNLRAATMAFSVQDLKCRPGIKPEAEVAAKKKAGFIGKHRRGPPVKAQLHIDASKLRVPHFIRKAQAQGAVGVLDGGKFGPNFGSIVHI